MMKDVFYFTLKALSFFLYFFGHLQKRLQKKAKVNSKIHELGSKQL